MTGVTSRPFQKMTLNRRIFHVKIQKTRLITRMSLIIPMFLVITRLSRHLSQSFLAWFAITRPIRQQICAFMIIRVMLHPITRVSLKYLKTHVSGRLIRRFSLKCKKTRGIIHSIARLLQTCAPCPWRARSVACFIGDTGSPRDAWDRFPRHIVLH